MIGHIHIAHVKLLPCIQSPDHIPSTAPRSAVDSCALLLWANCSFRPLHWNQQLHNNTVQPSRSRAGLWCCCCEEQQRHSCCCPVLLSNCKELLCHPGPGQQDYARLAVTDLTALSVCQEPGDWWLVTRPVRGCQMLPIETNHTIIRVTVTTLAGNCSVRVWDYKLQWMSARPWLTSRDVSSPWSRVLRVCCES